jgi:predicted RNA binding protein YcfA (HicA-like mRNA interferase family)
MSDLPALSGKRLLKILKEDGWIEDGKRTHGIAVRKWIDGETRIAIIPTCSDSLPPGALSAILSNKQTGLGREGLKALLRRRN